MKYSFSLVVNGTTVLTSSRKAQGQLALEELKTIGDQIYFQWIDGPNGPPSYPEATLEVKSLAPAISITLVRRANSNAAGVPSLWSAPEDRMGFICPDWAIQIWDPSQCSIEKASGVRFVVLDHSIHTTVFAGSEQECKAFLDRHTKKATYLENQHSDEEGSRLCPSHGYYWWENGCLDCTSEN